MNKGRTRVVFQPGEWVWVHFRKQRFPNQRKSKLHVRGDGPFQVIERINDNAYSLDLPGEYNISATFNVADLSLFDAGDDFDSRTNPFGEGGNDMNHMKAIQPIIQMDQKEHTEDIGSHEDKLKLDGPYLNHEDNALNDDLKLHQSPITISYTKKFQDVLQGFMKTVLANHKHEDPKRFNGFCGSEIEAKWALFNILAVHVFDDYG